MTIPLNAQTAQDLLGPDAGDYIGIQDLIDCKSREFLIDVTDDATQDRDPTGTYDVALIGRQIRKAMDEVNMYLANRYTVPITAVPIPNQVKTWTCSIALYFLGRRRDRVDSSITEDMQRTIAQMEAVREGDLPIPGLTRRTTGVLHNHTRDDTEPQFTLTRFNRSGDKIDKGEIGTLDVL